MLPTQPTDSQMDAYVSYIKLAYADATPEQIAKGQQWYPVAHDLAGMIGAGNVSKGAGVIAALSVQKSWSENTRLALDAASGNLHGHTGANLAKARAIMDGIDPVTVLPMNAKTGHFYLSILDPTDPYPVCIDRHAHDIAIGGLRLGNADRGLSNPNRYRSLRMAYGVAASELGLIPSVLQAITWVAHIESRV